MAGILGGQIDAQSKLVWTHDRSGNMSSDQWSREACLLAYEIAADVIVAEHNYGGDLVRLAIRTAWDALQREGTIPADALCPRIKLVHSKKGKLLRAEPVAQLVIEDHVRFGPGLTEFKHEWMTWQANSPWSPGRIDAGVHLAYAAVKVPGAEARVSTVTEKTRQSTGVSTTAARQINRRA
jgi:phage terminase large subunit-like protein